MATAIHIPLAEYLETSYRPDREYIDGEVRERNVGRWDHARLMALLAGWIGSREREWNVIAGLSLKVQVSVSRIRVPDVVVLLPGPQPDVLTDPPLLVIEILLRTTATPTLRNGPGTTVRWVWKLSGSSIPGREAGVCAAVRNG